MRVCVCMHVSVCACVRVYACMRIVHVGVGVCACLNECMHTHKTVWYIRMYVHTYIYTLVSLILVCSCNM